MNAAARWLHGSLAVAIIFIAGCATPLGDSPEKNSQPRFAGRLALQVFSEPARAFSASFELRGAPERGTLELSGPLGASLGQLSWQPGLAVLKAPNQEPREFGSLAALTTQLLGAELPLTALFDWLRGQRADAPGWEADLSALNNKRLSAKRLHPLPAAQLRLVLE